MRKIIPVLALILVLTSISFADSVIEHKDGVVSVSYKSSDSSMDYKVLIVKGKEKASYSYVANGKAEYFPLQFGNGKYTVGLMRRVEGKKFVYVSKQEINLDLKDDKGIYLASVQNIRWNEKDRPIRFAKTKSGIETAKDAAKEFHDYMVSEIVYDTEKASNVKSGYVPSIVDTFVKSRGICYDYASLFAAFMRSRGFHTRLVKGYADGIEEYHAWNEVLIDGKWVVMDMTVDAALEDFGLVLKDTKKYKKVIHY